MRSSTLRNKRLEPLGVSTVLTTLYFLYYVLLTPLTWGKLANPVVKVNCNLTTGECFCPEDPLTDRYPDPTDPTCIRYFLCHLGRAHRKVCDVRKAFNPVEGECMPRQRIPESICKYPVQCPIFRNVYVEDPRDCSKYYLCFYQRPSHYSCPELHYFDPPKQKCIRNSWQAEACQEQADLDRQNVSQHLLAETTLTSSSLTRAKENADANRKTQEAVATEPKKWYRGMDPIGKALKGGSRSLFSKT